ncbi:MAG TPA: hypothetical protein VFX22_04125 [Candidatus Kapabacteria bacterium]|nr:hypothetical protein [Candidatus Kapabacteria bacterium]
MKYDKGPLGALMDEYERAMEEYILVIANLDPSIYEVILNPDSKDPVAARGIAFHTLFAGYAYANGIRQKFGMEITSPEKFYPEQTEFPMVMRAMFDYTEASLEGHWSMTDEELTATIIPVRWSDHHDLEALLEHAIVHILRHRRQIERLTSRAR